MKIPNLRGLCLMALFCLNFASVFSQRHNNPYLSFTNQSAKLFTAESASVSPNWVTGYELRFGIDPRKMVMPASSRLKNVHFTGVYYDLGSLNNKSEQGEKDIYGEQFALLAGSDFKLANSEHLVTYLTVAGGPAFVTKTYFQHNENRLIGSKLNIAIKTDLTLQYILTPKLSLVGNASYYHVSNGGLRIPNGALQLLHTGIGFKYYFFQYINNKPGRLNSSPCYLSHARSCRMKTTGLEIGLGGGIRGGINSKKQVLKNTIWAGINFDLSEYLNLRPTADLFYNSQPEVNMVLASSTEKWYGGTSLMADIKFDRIMITAGYGFYLYFPSPHQITNYSKLGLRYRITDRLYANYIIKLHRDQPDYIDVGISMRLQK